MYDIKALYEAESAAHAAALRVEHPEAQIIAGGSDVLVQIREGRRAGAELISLYALDGGNRMVGIFDEEGSPLEVPPEGVLLERHTAEAMKAEPGDRISGASSTT